MRPSRAWLDAAVLASCADEASAALPELLCGVWWIAPMARDGAAPRVCGACGCACADLDVHFVLGGVLGGAPCSCPHAAIARAAFFARVAPIYAEVNLGAPPVALQSRAALARVLGGRRGVARAPLPVEAALALPRAFVVTLGAFAADVRAARAAP